MSNNSSYTAIAPVYDLFNRDIDYEEWADFIEKCFEKYLPEKPALVLDLACGTGRMTVPLARRGYDMIGVDASSEMLSEAVEKTPSSLGVLYLLQDMTDFELYGTVGAVVSCLDSINYITDTDGLRKCFSLVHNYLDPDGLFIFDINSEYKFVNVYGNNSYVFEDVIRDGANERDVFCAWQNSYDPDSRLCDFYLSVFSENGEGTYERNDENQTERCYSVAEISNTLTGCGFELLAVCGGFDFQEARPDSERIYFAARCKKAI